MPKLEIVISDTLFEDYKVKFLKVHPNTETKIKAGAIPDPNTGEYSAQDFELKFSDNAWLKEWLRRQCILQYQRGKEILDRETQVKVDISKDIT